MGWLGKKSDPLAVRAKDLGDEIARLEREIAKLSAPPKAGRVAPLSGEAKLPAEGSPTTLPSAPIPAPLPPPEPVSPAIAPLNSSPTPGSSSPARPAKPLPGPSSRTIGVDRSPRPGPAPTPTPAVVSANVRAPGQDARFNAQGVRKFDIQAWWQRLMNHFRGPTANNPRMVQFLAAGSVHGLTPLRYEKRVARNRFIGLFALLLLVLWGLSRVLFR
jgi:hypothetical protein